MNLLPPLSGVVLVVLASNVSHALGYGAALVLVGGLLALGAVRSLAWAWKGERDAAVAKAERLDEEKHEREVATAALTARVAQLEQATDVEQFAKQIAEEHHTFAKQMIEEHRLIIASLDANTATMKEMLDTTHALTVAVEFMVKQGLDLSGLAKPA